jgi:sec-independent protein translocase protein TatA
MIENLFQPTHVVLVLAIALLVFGPKNLPQIGKGMGEAIRGFKDAVKDDIDPKPGLPSK